MGLLDGSLVNLCTFPGIFVHQFFYLAACRYYKVESAFSLFNFTQFLSPSLVTVGESDLVKFGKQLERIANIGSALTCCALGALNEFTSKGSFIEGALLWIAVSIGVHSFPLRNAPGGKVLTFIWLDALYGVMLYFLGKLPLAALVTWFPGLGISGTRLY
jgi:hypothetical protein